MKQFIKGVMVLIMVLTQLLPATAGDQVTEQRKVKKFCAVSLQIQANVVLRDGNPALTITSSQEMLSRITTEVHNGELIIRYSGNSNYSSAEPVNIELSASRIVALEINGTGSITAMDEIASESLRLGINGPGSMIIPSVSVKILDVAVNGSGSISEIRGSVETLKLLVNGSGEINTPALNGKSVECSVTGSGQIRMSASESLIAEITGSGDIVYNGSPVKKRVDITGTGTVTAQK
jgi:hypothetical protein